MWGLFEKKKKNWLCCFKTETEKWIKIKEVIMNSC